MIPNRKISLLAGVSVAAMALGQPSVVAQDDQDSIEEIRVTATKRSENIQDVPLSITALDAVTVKRLNLDDVKELIKFAPGMAGDTQDSFVDFVNVRGISTNDFGNGSDPSIGFFKNGLYQGRTGSAVTSLYDLDRAEVLRGPQGFLFGRNAISGAISFHTMRPEYNDNSGYVEFGVGERGIFEGEGAINMPLGENTAIRVAGYASQEDGYITNIAMPNADPLYGHKKAAGRLTAVTKGDDWDAMFMVEYEDKKGSGVVYNPVDAFSEAGVNGAHADGISTFAWLSEISGLDLGPATGRTTNSNMGQGNDDDAQILSFGFEFNYDLGWADFRSLTGYKDHKYFYAEDYDSLPISFYEYTQAQEGDYFEQELRLVSKGDSKLSWYAGVSYFKENIDTTFTSLGDEDIMCNAYAGTASYYAQYYYPGYYSSAFQTCADLYTYWGYSVPTPIHGLLEGSRTVGSFKGWGAYVDINYEVSDKFDIGVGLRYTKNKKDYKIDIFPVTSGLGHWYLFPIETDGFVSSQRSWDDFTPRFIARYKPNDNMMLYASVTKGFKAGGYNSLGVNYDPNLVTDNGTGQVVPYIATGATPDSFEQETVWSYEVGMKGSTSDNRVRYDISGYHYIYTDLQMGYWDAGEKVTNVGRVKSYGIEASVQAMLSSNFDIILAGSYNDNEITGADLVEPGSDGNRLAGSPKYKIAGMLSYHTPMGDNGELNASVDFVAQTSRFLGLANYESTKLRGYSDVSARVGYESDDGWGIVAYVENVFDTLYYSAGYESGYPFPGEKAGVSRPRTFGARLSYKFGK